MVKRLAIVAALIGIFGLMTTTAFAAAPSGKVDLGILTVKNKDLANKLHKQLTKGASFESLAKQNSVGPASFRGGRLGKVPYKRLRSEYLQALKNLPPNKPSKVIPTEEGYTILMRFGQAGARASQSPAAPARAAAPKMDLSTSLGASAKFRSAQGPAPKVDLAAPSIPDEQSYLVARREVLAGLESMVAGGFAKAEKHFSNALGENPQEDSALFLSEVAREANKGKVKPAAAKLFAEGFVAMTEGDGETALQKFSQCKTTDPDFWQGELFAANLLAGAGQTAKAKEILQKVIVQKPGSFRAHVTLGMMAADAGKPKEARKHLEEAVKINPEFAQAHYQLGMVSLYSDDMKTAEREFKQAITLDPYSGESHNNLGLVYMFKGEAKKAEAEYKKALELNTSYPDAHVNLGNLFASKKKYNMAVDEYVKALAIDPSFSPALSNMAAAYVLMKKWPEAIRAADKALKLGYPVPKPLLAVLTPHRKGPAPAGASPMGESLPVKAY